MIAMANQLLGKIFISLCLALVSLSASARDFSGEMPEGQAKAALLYNFIKHTEWPDNKQRDAIRVAFLSEADEFYKAFSTAAKQSKINNKPITVELISQYQDASSKDVLVIAKQYNDRLADIASYLSGTHTLLVTDKAQQRASVMINYLAPESSRLSFEVNSTNLRFEGLDVSKDLLLYGGSEVEIISLYKEMEQSLLQSKAQLLNQEKELRLQKHRLDSQQQKIAAQNGYIVEQQADIARLSEEQLSAQNLLNDSALQLNQSHERLRDAQQRYNESRELSKQLEVEIEKNKSILSNQAGLLASQETQLQNQAEQLGEQENTITSQRGVIVIALSALLLASLYIVVRQKSELKEERRLAVAKEKVVKMQEESIDLYKSSLEAKNNFLTAINHELRTPMHLILGALHNISNDDMQSLQSSLNIVEQGAEHMMVLISDILFYSELQADQVEINTTSTKIKKQLIETVELYREQAEAKSLGFYLHFSHKVPEYVSIDSPHFNMVVEKLLDNAVKYTASGEVVINVDWQVQKGGELLLQVTDSGIGFSDEELAHVFEPFEQSDAGLARQFEGLGIGLSISKKLINLMGGDILIESEKGRGSTVFLSLPVSAADHAGKPPQQHLQLAVDNTKRAAMILIVEDNSVSQLVTEKLVAGLGYECLIANDGNHALELVEKRKPDLILMDLQMPNLDGIACTKILKKSEGLDKIPVVALTANVQAAIRKECFDAGMTEVLNKPIEVQKLDAVLADLLRVSSFEQEV
jgi:signal transduction histidine kinase/ActR/RegA family two-component response regulator